VDARLANEPEKQQQQKTQKPILHHHYQQQTQVKQQQQTIIMQKQTRSKQPTRIHVPAIPNQSVKTSKPKPTSTLPIPQNQKAYKVPKNFANNNIEERSKSIAYKSVPAVDGELDDSNLMVNKKKEKFKNEKKKKINFIIENQKQIESKFASICWNEFSISSSIA